MQNILHVSWPRCRVNSLKRSELWTYISSLPTCAWNMLMLWPLLVTGKTGPVEHVIFINRTRVHWFLNSQETLCLLVSAIYLYFRFIKCTFSGSMLCPIRRLLSCPQMCYTGSWPLDSNPWEQGQWALSPLVPAKVVTMVRMFVFDSNSSFR